MDDPAPLGVEYGKRDEGDVAAVEVAQPGGEGPQLRQAEALVSRQGLGGRIQQRRQPDRIGERAGGEHLLQDLRNEVLLVDDPVQVSGCQALAVTDEREGLGAGDVRVRTRCQVVTGVLVGTGGADAKRHAADGVDDLAKAVEVDLQVVVDRQAAQSLDGLDQQVGTTDGEGLVELGVVGGGGHACLVGEGRDLHVGVARERHQRHLGRPGRDVDEDHRVGSLARHRGRAGRLELRAIGQLAGVGAGQQEVGAGGDRGALVQAG